MKDPLTQIMGTVDAATLWNVTPDYVKHLCQQGKVKAVRIGKSWVLDKNQPNPSKK